MAERGISDRQSPGGLGSFPGPSLFCASLDARSAARRLASTTTLGGRPTLVIGATYPPRDTASPRRLARHRRILRALAARARARGSDALSWRVAQARSWVWSKGCGMGVIRRIIVVQRRGPGQPACPCVDVPHFAVTAPSQVLTTPLLPWYDHSCDEGSGAAGSPFLALLQPPAPLFGRSQNQ